VNAAATAPLDSKQGAAGAVEAFGSAAEGELVVGTGYRDGVDLLADRVLGPVDGQVVAATESVTHGLDLGGAGGSPQVHGDFRRPQYCTIGISEPGLLPGIVNRLVELLGRTAGAQ
jgi:hypothetical protein